MKTLALEEAPACEEKQSACKCISGPGWPAGCDGSFHSTGESESELDSVSALANAQASKLDRAPGGFRNIPPCDSSGVGLPDRGVVLS